MKRGSRYSLIGICSVLAAFLCACEESANNSAQDKVENPEVCSEDVPCGIGYSCVESKCLEDVGAGDACDDTKNCIEGTCIDGVCTVESEPSEQLGKEGDDCARDGDCDTENGLACIKNVCTVTAGLGEDCTSTACIKGLICRDGICKNKLNPNSPCDPNDETSVCTVGACIDGRCSTVTEEDNLKIQDTDGDTISDYYDRCDVDTDGDTMMDCNDPDSDNDTIPDKVEAGTGGDLYSEPMDSDLDGVYDFLDTDSDQNGIPDAFEGCPNPEFPYTGPESAIPTTECTEPIDTDNDGYPDYLDEDNDGDKRYDTDEITGFKILTGNTMVPARMCGDTPCEAGTPESPWDTDGDTIPDYMTIDSDGDTISDTVELLSDTDKDGTADIYDTDSDNDGLLDSEEKDVFYLDEKTGLKTMCVLSPDCDGDGLIDSKELHCDLDIYDPLGIHGVSEYTGNSSDADNDGYADAAEYAAAEYAIKMNQVECLGNKNADMCFTTLDPATGKPVLVDKPEQLLCDRHYTVEHVFDFYFELPYEGDAANKELEFKPSVSQLDVVINLDVTGSMQNEIDDVKANLQNKIIPGVRQRVTDSAFAISAFADFPVNKIEDKDKKDNPDAVRYGYGVSSGKFQADIPWNLLSPVTKDTSKLSSAVGAYALTDGMDYPESGYESLWQIAAADTATADTQTQYANMTFNDSRFGTGYNGYKTMNIPTNDADHWGGASFRKGALPVVVHITDAPSHGSTMASKIETVAQLKEYIYNGEYIKNAHTDADVHQVYKDHGIRLLTVYRRSADDAKNNKDKEGVASGAQHPVLMNSSLETQALVPVCAFQKSATDWTCGDNKCCTVTTAEGSVDPNADGDCVLSYGIVDGKALSTTLVDGIDALVKYGTYEVATRIVGEPIEGSDKDTSCFIKKVEAKNYIAPAAEPEASCNPAANPHAFDGADYNNGFTNFATGTSSKDKEGAQLTFTIHAQNDVCVAPKPEAQTFMAYIELYEPATNLLLGRRQVYIIVPGESDFIQIN